MKSQISYVCSECGFKSIKWLGKCPECQSWSTFEEVVLDKEIKAPRKISDNHAEKFSELVLPTYLRTNTGMNELDRVLGGGLALGSVVLLSGEPGIGKSTLLLQISAVLAQNRKVLYVSGEESKGQLKLRAERLGVNADSLYLYTETDTDLILEECTSLKPDVVIIDSVQTLSSMKLSSAPGSITQVREGAMAFISYAKTTGAAIFLVGHVNKEGGISGPKFLEHMVDAVLYFEGERMQSYRIIRAIKNRYGSTNEIGVFEMTDKGLYEVQNPSEMLLSGRPEGVSGSCAVCIMEGTRPIIAEIQALVTPTSFQQPRRTANGLDYNRVCLIIAILEKRLGLKFSQCDIYLNVVGGLKLDEPSVDLALALALISSIKDIPVPQNVIAMGELGLAGECRAISDLQKRISESYRLGFTTIAIPQKSDRKKLKIPKDVSVIDVRSVFDALTLFKKDEQ